MICIVSEKVLSRDSLGMKTVQGNNRGLYLDGVQGRVELFIEEVKTFKRSKIPVAKGFPGYIHLVIKHISHYPKWHKAKTFVNVTVWR